MDSLKDKNNRLAEQTASLFELHKNDDVDNMIKLLTELDCEYSEDINKERREHQNAFSMGWYAGIFQMFQRLIYDKKHEIELKKEIKELGVFQDVGCMRLLRLIEAEPGITFDQICRTIRFNKSILEEMIRILIEVGIVKNKRDDLTEHFEISPFGEKLMFDMMV